MSPKKVGGCGSLERKFVTELDVARRLGISPGEVRELASQSGFPSSVGEIESSSPPIKKVLFWRLDDVKRWASEHGLSEHEQKQVV